MPAPPPRPACLTPRPAPAMRCRTELYLHQGGAARGAAGPASAPRPPALGGPGLAHAGPTPHSRRSALLSRHVDRYMQRPPWQS